MKRRRPSEEEREAAKQRRAAQRAAAEAADREQKNELHRRRAAQLSSARGAVSTLSEKVREAQQRRRQLADLESHLAGFYEEVDKLAKGKTMLEVTPLVLTEANQVIRDAKDIVDSDAFLGRVKEFVPAGNNPVYPDVVIAMRTVREALRRARARFESFEKAMGHRLREARTISVALDVLLAESERPTLGAVRQHANGVFNVDENWFEKLEFAYTSEQKELRGFDFFRLDAMGALDQYLLLAEEQEGREGEE